VRHRSGDRRNGENFAAVDIAVDVAVDVAAFVLDWVDALEAKAVPAGLRARTSWHRGLPSRCRPSAVKASARTVKPAAVRSARTAGNGQVR
jgi:hypothetical protein